MSAQASAVCCTSSGSVHFYVRLRMPPKPWSRLSSTLGWSTAIRCTTVDEPSAVSPERRSTSHHWSQAGSASTSRQSYVSCTGYHSAQWVEFKLSTLVYHSLAGTAPVYLADECTLFTATGCRPLRSADSQTCMVKRSRNQLDDCCFATARPTL